MSNRNSCLLIAALAISLAGSARAEREERDLDCAFEGGDPGDWPSYNHDLHGSRHNCFESRLDRESVKGLAVRWRFPTAAPILGTPSVAGGHIYAGDMSGAIYALDRNGRQQWKASGFAPFLSTTPLVSGGSLVIGDASGRVHSLDRRTGALQWTARPNPHPLASVWGSPIAVGGSIIMGMASNEEEATLDPNYPCCSFRGSVFSLDAETGAINWQTFLVDDWETARGTAGVAVWSTPTYDSDTDTLYVGTGNSYHAPDGARADALVALDATTGAIRWANQRTAGDISTARWPGPPGINDSDFGDSPKLYRLSSGRKVVGAGEKNGFIIVCDAATGELVNGVQYLPPASNVGAFQNGIAHAGHLFFTNGTNWPDVLLDPNNPFPPPTAGMFFAIRDDGSQLVWQFAVPGSINQTGIAVANGVVYGQSHFSRKLYALDARSGEQLAAVDIGVSLSGPSVSHGQVYVGTGNVIFAGPGPLLFDPTGSITALGAAEDED
jgi:polyvinyl alcohol dehydrogenase (cytochrome)